MQNKKSKKADLESKRSMFFLTGLAVAIFLAITVIQIESTYSVPKLKEQKKALADETFTRITRAPEPEKHQQEQQKVHKIDPSEIFKIVDNLTDDQPQLSVQKPNFNDDPMEEIGMEDEPDIPTMAIVSVQEVAVPMSCVDLVGREDRMNCLNEWVQQFVYANATYPEISKKWGEEDKVYVSFVIDENGDVGSVELVRGDYEKLNEEALRVVQKMPRFSPAKHQGRKVKMLMRIPVNFKLN